MQGMPAPAAAPAPDLPTQAEMAAEVAAAWRDALAVWQMRVELSPPEPFQPSGGAGWPDHAPKDEPLAYLDMKARQVVVNLPLLVAIGARGSLTAVLAHEVGHHVRHPHTLGLAAELELLEKRLLPGQKGSLLNLFFDLLVNEHVGRTRARELADVYRGFVGRDGPPGPLFWFYLAVYEELWGEGAGPLVPEGSEAAAEAAFPGCRAEARLFAQTFYALPDVFLQLVYFCSVFSRYATGAGGSAGVPLAGDVPAPDVDDYDGAVQGSPRAERALAEARARGWIKEGSEPATAPAPLAAIQQAASGRPGSEQQSFVQTLVARFYKRLVDRHLIALPATAPPPDPLLPTTLAEWEVGDDARAIDWTASLLAGAALAPARPLRRELEAEAPAEAVTGAVALEIYLDTSGSMPSPETALNAMTLAAQILSASALRKRGKVRGVVYSMDAVLSEWMYDEEAARQFFLLYNGGGTRFPFATLARLAGERADVIRVVISDADFLDNLSRTEGAFVQLGGALAATRRLVVLLALSSSWQKQVAAAFGALLADARLRVVLVEDLNDFGRVAADLARALFGR
jgi:hypothetical protein